MIILVLWEGRESKRAWSILMCNVGTCFQTRMKTMINLGKDSLFRQKLQPGASQIRVRCVTGVLSRSVLPPSP